jgi:hypothetical protein
LAIVSLAIVVPFSAPISVSLAIVPLSVVSLAVVVPFASWVPSLVVSVVVVSLAADPFDSSSVPDLPVISSGTVVAASAPTTLTTNSYSPVSTPLKFIPTMSVRSRPLGDRSVSGP